MTKAPTPRPTTSRLRRRWVVAARVSGTAAFTAVEAWAVIMVLTGFTAAGASRVALAIVLAGAVLALLYAWEETRGLLRGKGRPDTDDG
jgi:membrane-bound ClpP family serine protease